MFEQMKRYDWKLDGPFIKEIETDNYDDAFVVLSARIVTYFSTGGLINDALEDFPLGEVLPNSEETSEPYVEAWRAIYTNTDIGINSTFGNTYLRIVNPDPVLLWLLDQNIADEDGTIHTNRYQALQANGFLNSEQAAAVEAARDIPNTFHIDVSNAPDWARSVALYSANLGNAFISEDIVTEENIDAGDVVGIVNTGVGVGLATAAAIAGNTFYFPIGVALTITGVVAFVIGKEENNRAERYILDREALLNTEDYHYQEKNEIGLARGEIQQIEVPWLDTFKSTGIFLDAFYNQSPPEKLDAIALHAGRIYGVDRETEEIVFSHIDGNGVSNYWAFPPSNALPTTASGISPVEKIEQMPNRGGLYVFKRDAIHYIDGQNIFSGLYDINVSANTDISAADYKKNVGCISARSVKNDGSMVLFVGSDAQIYSLSGKTATPIGVNVKPFIEDLEIDDLQDVVTEWQNERFYLTLPDSTLILNTERKYWTRFDWALKDILWTRGGIDAENIFYGLTIEDNLVELQVDNPDEVFPVKWEANTLIRRTCSLLTGIYVYTDREAEITITIQGKRTPENTDTDVYPETW